MSEYEDAVEALGRVAVERIYASYYLPNEVRTTSEYHLAWESKDGTCVLTATNNLASILVEDLDHIMLSTTLDYVLGKARARKERLTDSIKAQGQEAEEILDLIRKCESLFMEQAQA